MEEHWVANETMRDAEKNITIYTIFEIISLQAKTDYTDLFDSYTGTGLQLKRLIQKAKHNGQYCIQTRADYEPQYMCIIMEKWKNKVIRNFEIINSDKLWNLSIIRNS